MKTTEEYAFVSASDGRNYIRQDIWEVRGNRATTLIASEYVEVTDIDLKGAFKSATVFASPWFRDINARPQRPDCRTLADAEEWNKENNRMSRFDPTRWKPIIGTVELV